MKGVFKGIQFHISYLKNSTYRQDSPLIKSSEEDIL